jgi:hypothetical protein
MTDLVSLFRNFIYRDLAFILGGAIVLLSAVYALRSCARGSLYSLPNKPFDEPYILFLFTVLAYVVGYTVQDFGAVLVRLTYTGYIREPNRFCKVLYDRFTGHEWKPLSSFASLEDMHEFGISMHKLNIPKAALRDLERIRSLKVFSMCIGGCSGLSALIWLVKWGCNHSATMNLRAVILLLAFGIASICLGWVKALQEMQFYQVLKTGNYTEKKERASNSDQLS